MTDNAHQSASKIAQLIGEVIVHHAPWTSDIAENTRRRITDAWLDRLEDYQAGLLHPLFDQIIEGTDTHPAIAAFLARRSTRHRRSAVSPRRF